MIGLNTVLVIILILVLIIVIISMDLFGVKDDNRLILYECSLFLDKISEDKNLVEKCELSYQVFEPHMKNVKNFLNYLKNNGLFESEFFFISDKSINIYKNYFGFYFWSRDDKEILNYKKLWKNAKNNHNILMNNLMKKEYNNEILLYKTYNCDKNNIFIIGFNLK